jgi:hypothetical protein
MILARARFQPRYCTWKAAPTVFGDRALTVKTGALSIGISPGRVKR